MSGSRRSVSSRAKYSSTPATATKAAGPRGRLAAICHDPCISEHDSSSRARSQSHSGPSGIAFSLSLSAHPLAPSPIHTISRPSRHRGVLTRIDKTVVDTWQGAQIRQVALLVASRAFTEEVTALTLCPKRSPQAGALIRHVGPSNCRYTT